MQSSSIGSYSTSNALSPAHYKLVQALEQAIDPADVNKLLLDCLGKIRSSWLKRRPKPSQAYVDLVLVMYCKSQQAAPATLEYERELVRGEWALVEAVRLAGGGTKLAERQLGYRACCELFETGAHPLKLLLVNTIHSDLHAPIDTSKAEQRWIMALRAIMSPNLVIEELVSSVQERVLELFEDPDQLVRIVDNELNKTRRRGSSIGGVWALSNVLSCLEEILEEGVEGQKDEGREAARLFEALERTIETLLRRLLEEPDGDGRGMKQGVILSALRLDNLLAAWRTDLRSTSPSLPASNTAPSSTLDTLLSYAETVLRSIRPKRPDPNAHLFVLHVLALVPVENWTGGTASIEEHESGTTSNVKGKGVDRNGTSRPAWNEKSWAAILNGVNSPDARIRRATLHLFQRVDPNLVQLQYDRLVSTLTASRRSVLPDSLVKSSYSRSSTAEVDHLNLIEAIVPLALETMTYLPTALTSTSPSSRSRGVTGTSCALPDAPTLYSFLSSPDALGLLPTQVSPALVLGVLAHFKQCQDRIVRVRFARDLVNLDSRDDGSLGGDRQKAWATSVAVGLLVSGVVHVLAENPEQTSEEELQPLVDQLGRWLANVDESTDLAILQILQEPILLALLRVVALSPGSEQLDLHLASSVFRGVAQHLDQASRLATYDNRPLFGTALRALENLAQLRQVGHLTRDGSLADFGSKLSSIELGASARTDGDRRRSESVDSERGLEDDPTDSEVTSNRLRTIERSIATLRRERAELRRERQDRGGTPRPFQGRHDERQGAREVNVESLMGPEEVELRDDLRRRSETDDSLDDDDHGEPSSNLLFELESLDPFRAT
ncbi:hypothetical protein JCM10212_001379 [Sporobolomyces blumeae]